MIVTRHPEILPAKLLGRGNEPNPGLVRTNISFYREYALQLNMRVSCTKI